MSWNEVRRSAPAEHVAGVRDDSTVWACWIEEEGERSLTVYKSEAEGYALVAHVAENETVIARGVEEDEALETAEEMREDDDLWRDHTAWQA